MALKYLRSKKTLKIFKEKNLKNSGLIWYKVSDRGVKDQVQSA